MGSTSSWKMRVEKGIPRSPPQFNDSAAGVDAVKITGAGESDYKRSAGLPDEEACADEDDNEDD